MSQIFHRSTNTFSKVSIFGAVFFLGFLLWLFGAWSRSSWATQAGVAREQPIPFSHAHHVGDEGIDCRYCHTSVETSAFANIPPTKTCMNCHSQIWNTSPTLEPVRESFRTGPLDRLDPRPRSARFRLLQPQHPCEQGRRMRNLPRPRRQDAAHLAEGVAPNGVVPRLPSPSRAVRSPAGRSFPNGLRTARRSNRNGPKISQGI